MRFEGEDSLIRCFAHILNLIVDTILQELGSSTHKAATEFLDRVVLRKWDKITIPGASGVIAKLRMIVLWITRSPQRIQEWDSKSKKAINYDVDTRWNSTIRMVEDAEDCRLALDETIKDHPELEALSLTKQDWQQLRDIRTILTPFKEFTEYISRSEPTLYMSAKLYIKLKDLLSLISQKQGQYAQFDNGIITAVKKGREKFEEYYGLSKDLDVYYIAVLLDPRTRASWIRKNVQDSEEVITRLRIFLKASYPSEVQLPSLKYEKKSFEATLFDDDDDDTLDELGVSDIDRYIDSAPTIYKFKEGEHVGKWLLNWWESSKYEYPCMSQVARDYLAIPGSEVDVERLFNAGRDVLGIRRFSMKGETLGMMMRLKDVLRRKEAGQLEIRK
jgi:hypothetical protein